MTLPIVPRTPPPLDDPRPDPRAAEQFADAIFRLGVELNRIRALGLDPPLDEDFSLVGSAREWPKPESEPR